MALDPPDRSAVDMMSVVYTTPAGIGETEREVPPLLMMHRTSCGTRCPTSRWHANENARRHPPPIPRQAFCRAAGGWRVVGHVVRGARPSTRVCDGCVCACATVFQQMFFYSARCCAWPTYNSSLVQASWTTWTIWCNSNEKRTGGESGQHTGRRKSTSRGKRGEGTRRFRECRELTIRALYRDHQGGVELGQ